MYDPNKGCCKERTVLYEQVLSKGLNGIAVTLIWNKLDEEQD